MKKFILAAALSTLAFAASAQHGHGRHGHHHGDHRWVERAVIGAVIGYGLGHASGMTKAEQRQAELIAQGQLPVIIAPQPRVIVIPAPAPRPVYQETVEYNSDCNCYVKVLRQIGWQ